MRFSFDGSGGLSRLSSVAVLVQNTDFHMLDFAAHFKNFVELELKLTLRCPTEPSHCFELTGNNLPTILRESTRQRISMSVAPWP